MHRAHRCAFVPAGSARFLAQLIRQLLDQIVAIDILEEWAGSGILLNGVTLSSQDLQKLLMEYKTRITSVRFED